MAKLEAMNDTMSVFQIFCLFHSSLINDKKVEENAAKDSHVYKSEL